MTSSLTRVEAIVLRTIRYGDSDLIVHLCTSAHGRMSAIAKGARSAKLRVGTRIEPWTHIQCDLKQGKGALPYLQGAHLNSVHEEIRSSYIHQVAAAEAGDMLTRLTEEHDVNQRVFELLGHFLGALSESTGNGHVRSVLAAFQLKLLHVLGMTPELRICVRCGNTVIQPDGWSARDGGVVCGNCSVVADRNISHAVWATAQWLLRTRMSGIATHPQAVDVAVVSAVRRELVASIVREHAGVSLAMSD